MGGGANELYWATPMCQISLGAESFICWFCHKMFGRIT